MGNLDTKLIENFKKKDFGKNSIDWIEKYRLDGINKAETLGLPTVSNEDWRFTSLKDFSSRDFDLLWSNKSKFKEPNLPSHIKEIDGFFIYTLNGKLVSDKKLPFHLNELSDSFDAPEVKKVLLDDISDKNKDFFYELGSAFIQDGIFLKVDKSKKINKPIVIINIFDSEVEKSFINTRNVFYFEESSSAEIIEYSFSDKAIEYSLNKNTNVYIGNNSKVEHLLIEDGSKESFIFSNLKIIQEADSHFTTNSILSGGKLIRNNVHPMLNGKGCYSNILGLYLSIKDQLMDNYMFVEHLKENCGSRQLYKGLLDDKSKGVFHGRILVHEEAQQTNAYQTNRNLLLSSTAQVDTKPQLEIYADDVKCSHGATIGQLDQEALLYLRARGINKKKAMSMLIRAFTDEVSEPIENETLLQVFNDVVDDWFSKSKIIN